MEPWYNVAVPRKEVREGRSFNPDEFAIALEQVAAGAAPADYRDPEQFFSRTCWTRALRGHAGLVLRRLSGKTDNTAPVMTLITQFGGGKTHTLTALYHLGSSGDKAATYAGVPDLLRDAGLFSVPKARVAVFVGNAWDPQDGRETPWIDIARQLAGDAGVAALGAAAKDSPPGTESIARVFQAANAPVLLLFDEVLNFLNRYRSMADPFLSFIQNLTVAVTGVTHAAAVISLPRSQVEMTEWDMQWQEKISKVVRRVAKDLIVNDESEISEVVRRRLFENLGSERIRKSVAKVFADWCFERRAQLPSEWTAIDAAATEAKAREYLRSRFEACYPFHPATLSVFRRKWQALPQYQQTRGTLAMLAQWVAWSYRNGVAAARREPLITLGSAPLHDLGFRSTILGQLGESRLVAAIEADIAGDHAHARALDADTKGALRDIHRRVGTAILFESSGGQTDRVAHLPELRFALGDPDVDATSVDNAALALERKAYFIRRAGTDGFKIGYRPTLKKVVNDRRASLDEETEIKPAMRNLIEHEFRRSAGIPIVPFPRDGADVPDTPKLTLVIVDPGDEWTSNGSLRRHIAGWTRQRNKAPRLYPGALVWCVKKPGSDLREKVELWLAWQRVAREVDDGVLGGDFDRTDLADLRTNLKAAEESARDEVWGGYRFAVIYEPAAPHAPNADGLRVIDLGAAQASIGMTLCGRVIAALRSEAIISESVGSGYIERNWPPALKESGSWPLPSLLQSFLNGSLTRLLDPVTTLRRKIVEFVGNGDFGLASGQNPDGTYERLWFKEPVSADEVAFEPGVFLLAKAKAQALKAGVFEPASAPQPHPSPAVPGAGPGSLFAAPSTTQAGYPDPQPSPAPGIQTKTIRLAGRVPAELWNRLGTKILPKLRSVMPSVGQGADLNVSVDLSVTVNSDEEERLTAELRRMLEDLDLAKDLRLDVW